MQAAIVVFAGVAATLLAFAILVTQRSQRSPALQQTQTSEQPVAALVPDSLAHRISPGRVAVAAPSSSGETLLAAARAGDHIDIVAILPGPLGQPPLPALVVRGAVLLRAPPGAQGGPVVLEVTPDDAVALAHLIGRGTRLTFALWPAAGPPPVPSVDAAAVRARLDLVTPTAAAP